jgi:hypothetical protein
MNTNVLDQIQILNSLSDIGKWDWLRENTDISATVILEEETTYIYFEDSPDNIVYFNSTVGDSYGIYDLLESLDIEYQSI